MPAACRLGLAAETVGYIFDVGARVATDHAKPHRPPALGNAATGDHVLLSSSGHLQRERVPAVEQVDGKKSGCGTTIQEMLV